MKKLRFLMIALLSMLGLSSCSKDCDHNFIEHDYSEALVGTWTYISNDSVLAEAIEIKEDGSFAITGVMKGGHLYEEKGNIKVENNKVTLAYDSGDVFEGRLELVAGKSLSIVLFNDNDVRLTYDYCKEDLSEEVVGMWVCNDAKDNMRIHTFDGNGSSAFTGWSEHLGEFSVLDNSNYKVVGDLIFQGFSNAEKPSSKYIAARVIYAPNGTAHGDIMTFKHYLFDGAESAESWLRVKQNLDLKGNKYNYRATYVTNVKGEDKDIPFLNTSFNFAKMDGSIIDKFLKSTLFTVEFPDANTLKYSFLVNGQSNPMTAPIQVEGNKMTIKMSENGPFQDVEIYTFQDQDNTQMHLYMPTSSFEKFFANTSVHVMLGNGQLGKNDTEAIAAVYKNVADAVESINLSIVMTRATKSL